MFCAIVTTSTADFQVPYWGPVKWVAKIRSKEPSKENDILLSISDVTPHGVQQINSENEVAFLLHQTESNLNPKE